MLALGNIKLEVSGYATRGHRQADIDGAMKMRAVCRGRHHRRTTCTSSGNSLDRHADVGQVTCRLVRPTDNSSLEVGR